MKRTKKLLKIAFALILVCAGGLIILKDNFINDSIVSSFSEEPIKVVQFDLQNIPEENKPKQIIIPKLKIDLKIKESKVISGYWEVFDNGAGWGEGSSPPGYPGNQVIFAHAKEGLFGNLDNIKTDDQIYVFNQNNWYVYKVTEVKEVYPGQTEVIEQTEDERLTLYTCSGFRDQKRLVVVAKRN